MNESTLTGITAADFKEARTAAQRVGCASLGGYLSILAGIVSEREEAEQADAESVSPQEREQIAKAAGSRVRVPHRPLDVSPCPNLLARVAELEQRFGINND